jgi:hypothetical protein
VAVFTAPAGGRPRAAPLALAALKSQMGHAEPAAGVLGLVRLHAQLQAAAACPILHLRALNPYLQGSLRAASRQALMPRQAAGAPSAEAAARRPAGGVSAFAFQGTNAHALLEAGGAPGGPAGRPAAAAPPPLRPQRLYVVPRVHPLASGVRAAGRELALACRLGGARLAYLLDHRVAGRALLPAAAMLELAMAAAHTAAADAAAHELPPALCGVSISAPVVVPSGGGAGVEGVVVLCRLDCATGEFVISHGRGGAGRAGQAVNARGLVAAGLRNGGGGGGGLLDAAAAQVLAGVLPGWAQQGPPSGEGPSAVGMVAAVGAEWHASGYLTAPQQLDSCLHLGVVAPGAGARIPVALACFSCFSCFSAAPGSGLQGGRAPPLFGPGRIARGVRAILDGALHCLLRTSRAPPCSLVASACACAWPCC